MKRGTSQRGGFTLVELLIGSTIGILVSVGVFAFIDTGSMLTARNLSVNLTSNSMRTALDRLENTIQQAATNPRLMDTAGAAVTGNGPAAGVRFDRFVGGPVVVNPGSTTLASSATSFTIRYAQASSPAPSAGDIIRLDGTALTLRPRIASVTSNTAVSAGMRDAAVTLTAALGTTVTSTTGLRAGLVRDVAFAVMPAGGGRELRQFHDMAGTTNLNDASRFSVVTDQIAMEAGDATPFSRTTIAAREFVSLSLRLRANNFDRRLLGRQADQFNTFARVDVFMCPKSNP